jgi:hypothetical protein
LIFRRDDLDLVFWPVSDRPSQRLQNPLNLSNLPVTASASPRPMPHDELCWHHVTDWGLLRNLKPNRFDDCNIRFWDCNIFGNCCRRWQRWLIVGNCDLSPSHDYGRNGLFAIVGTHQNCGLTEHQNHQNRGLRATARDPYKNRVFDHR